jgi:hypothetical protein
MVRYLEMGQVKWVYEKEEIKKSFSSGGFHQ